MERCCHSFNNNHLVTVREWWSWLQEQNNVGSWEETGNDKSDSLLTSPSFTGLRILRTLWLLKNVTQLPPLLTTIRSHNSNGFADFVTWTQMSYFEASRKEDSLVGVSDIQFVFTLYHADVFSTVSLSLVVDMFQSTDVVWGGHY